MKFVPRQLVTIQKPTVVQDGRGSDNTTWSRVAVVWADMKQLAGRERDAALQVAAETTWRAYVRYAPGLVIEPEYRIEYGGKHYQVITAIDVNEEHQLIQIELKEYAA